MARTKIKAKTAEQREAERIAARVQDLAAVSLPADAAVLPVQQDIEITRQGQMRDGRKVDADSARRLDAFEALKPSMAGEMFAGCYDAARRLERDILTRYGWADRGRSMERVDCTAGLVNDASLSAGKRVDAVTQWLSLREGWLLVELITGHPDRPTWRETVAYITGETNLNAQGAAVRGACANLRDAYVRLDVAGRRAA